MPEITPSEFQTLARYIREISGIALDHTRTHRIESRLGPLLQETGATSYSDLYHRARKDASNGLSKKIIDAISTNETSFFRDTAPFDLLQSKLLPEHFDREQDAPRTLRIWSAGCSTGQEACSIAILVKELLPSPAGWKTDILGTDISSTAVARAAYGRYTRLELERGLSPARIERYFRPVGNVWQVKDDIRAMVNFQRDNLMQPSAGLGKFDIVFCRNVAIYLVPNVRQGMFDRLADHLNPAGSLLLGATESLTGITNRFERHTCHNTAFYRLK